MMRRPFHPIVFGLYPVLALYSLNTAIIPAESVPVPLAIVIGCTLAFWGVLALLLRNVARAAIGASIGVVVFFLDGHLWNFARQIPAIHQEYREQGDIFWIWLSILVVAVVLGSWKWKRTEQLTQTFNIVGLALAAIPCASILMSWYSAWRGQKITQIQSGAAKLDTTNRPDIFYVILDGYGRSDALQRVIGFSNAWFVKALEQRGFFIAKNGHSNYCQTELSLSSSLNLDYLPRLLPNLNPKWEDRSILDGLIDKNTVSKYLRKLGYRYEALTTGFPSVHPSSADLWLEDARGVSMFAGVLLAETPVPADNPTTGISQFESRRIMLTAAVRNLGRASSGGTQPRFVFVHILAPHPPFVFGPNGEKVRTPGMGYGLVDGSHFYDNGGTPREYASGYAGQATYISKIVLTAVDEIIKRSSKPPIIILQGDHGSKMRLNQELVEKTDVNECFPNLNAYLVPAKVRENLYEGITPVNSFRMIFDGLFGDTFPRLPDKSYYSGWSSPFLFVDVTHKIKPALSAQ